MRFSEFNLINEAVAGTKGKQADIPHFDAPGYFTVGDSHSNGVGNYGRGKTWKSLGMDGASAFNSMHPIAINRIPKGSVVAISLGANDIGKVTETGKPIPEIVAKVTSLIDLAQSKGLTVIYLLPTANAPDVKDQPTAVTKVVYNPKRDKLRDAMRSAVSVPIYDLGAASTTDKDRLHLAWGQYLAIGNTLAKKYEINNSSSVKPEVKQDKPISKKPEVKQDKFDVRSELDKLPLN
jgi:hypothetical protein